MNLLQRLVNDANQKRKQLGNTISNDVVAPIKRDVIAPVSQAGGAAVNAVSAHNTIQPVVRAVTSAAPVASRAYDQVNPLDNGRTYQQRTPTHQQSLINQITHNGATNTAGSLLNNITGIPTYIDTARLGVGELTHNQKAIDNATTSLAKNVTRTPLGMVEGVKPFAQDVATAATSPVAKYYANREEARAKRELTPAYENLYRNSGADPRLGANQADMEASATKNRLLNNQLQTAGFDQNTSQKDLVRRVAAQGASTALDMAFLSQVGNPVAAKLGASIPAAAERSLARQVVTDGAINAGASVAGVAGEANPHALDYVKAGIQGGVTGAAFPLAFAGAGAVGKYAPELAKAGASKIGQQAKDLFVDQPRMEWADQNTLRDYVDYLSKGYKPKADELNKLIADVHDIGKQYGIDVTSGSTIDVGQRIYDALNHQHKLDSADGGYARIPGKKVFRAGDALDPNKVTEDGISVTPSKKIAQKKFGAFWGRGPVQEHVLSPDAKVMPFNEIPKELYTKSPSGEISPAGPLKSNGNYQKIIEYAKSKGYDAVDLKRFGEGEIRVFDAKHLVPADAGSQPPTLQNKLDALPKTAGTKQEKPVKKTGVIDKQLNEITDAKNSMVNYLADQLREGQKSTRDVAAEVRKAGGISKSDYEDIPASVKNKSGLPMDEMAANLGFKDDGALYDALHNQPAKPLTRSEARAEVEKQLESGKHPDSPDYKQITDALKQRQDELSLYPKGARSQIKITTKAPKMTDSELQSLANTPEGSQPKQGNRVITNKPKTTLRNAEADAQVQEVLKKGGNSEEAIGTYMNATGADLQTAVRDVRRVAQESNLGFEGGKNPLAGKVPLGGHVAEGDSKQPFLNADFVRQRERAIGGDALDAFHSLSSHDKTLLQGIEKDTVSNVAKKADNPGAFKKAEQAIRTYYDTRHAYDTALGIDVGYRQNYLRQLFAKAEEAAKANYDSEAPLKSGTKRPGYVHERTNDTLHTEVGHALERDINGASNNHAKLAYAQGLEQAFPKQINNSGQLVRGADGKAYRQLTNRYGEGISAHPDIAQEINSRTWTPTKNKALQAYDRANAGIKYVKLGGGAFHAVTEAGNFVGQQLASGKLFTEPKATGTALRTFFSPKTMAREMSRLRSEGVIDNAQISGLKTAGSEILADANVSSLEKGKSAAAKYTGIQALHNGTFEREIPYMKLKMFEQKTKGLDPTKPEDIVKMRSAAKGVNSLFGGINRDIEGIKPDTFKRMQRIILATDFTESKIGTALRGVNLADRSPAAKLARQAVVGKALLFAGLAAAGGTLGGEYKDKNGKQIFKDILAKFADPSFKMGDYKVGFPATHVSEFTRPFESLFDSSKKTAADRLSGFQHYGASRLAAVPSAAFQGITNKDYSGNRIYGKDYKVNGGEQISPAKTATNVAGMFGPIPVSQITSTAQKKQNIPAALANIAGLRTSNDKLWNQDATPVNIKFGDSSTTLTKDKAIAFNAAVAKQQTALDTQLKSSDQYKKASTEDQKAMTTKLHGYITENQKRIAATQNNVPLDKAASAAVQSVNANKLPGNLAKGATSSVSVSNAISKTSKDFLTTYNTMTASDRTKNAYTKTDWDYKLAQAKYENDKANNKLSEAGDIQAQSSLRKDKIGATYSKDVRDLYGVSKANLADWLATPENGVDKQKIASDLFAYDKALHDAGIISTPKYKNGITASSGGGSRAKLTPSDFKSPFGNSATSSTKGAQLARNVKLVKANQVAVKASKAPARKTLPTLKKRAIA